MNLSRDGRELIAKSMTLYREELMRDDSGDLTEYNRVEVDSLDELARKLDLDPEYYRWIT